MDECQWCGRHNVWRTLPQTEAKRSSSAVLQPRILRKFASASCTWKTELPAAGKQLPVQTPWARPALKRTAYCLPPNSSPTSGLAQPAKSCHPVDEHTFPNTGLTSSEFILPQVLSFSPRYQVPHRVSQHFRVTHLS